MGSVFLSHNLGVFYVVFFVMVDVVLSVFLMKWVC